MADSREITDYGFFINREQGRPCLVAGNAPTIRDFPFADFKGVTILTGTGPRMLADRTRPDYWVNANYYYPVPQRHLKEINAWPSCIFFFADSVCYAHHNRYDHGFLTRHLNVPWFAFDERHFNAQKCSPPQSCCRLVELYPGRITFQEFIEGHFGTENISRRVGTAVLHSLALAILLGCNPIYIQGVELPLHAREYKYARGDANFLMTARAMKAGVQRLLTGRDKPSDFAVEIDTTLANFERLVALAHRLGIEVYNLSRTSTLNRVESLQYREMSKITT